MLSTSAQGYASIKSFEGRSLRAYKDTVGVWTIGYGNTNAIAKINGFEIKAGVTISEDQADQLLRTAVERVYEPDVRKALADGLAKCKFPQATFDAGTGFHYNTGAIKRASWVKAFNASLDASGILAWNKGGGRVLTGLVRRRKRELAMIVANDYGPEGVIKGAARIVPPTLQVQDEAKKLDAPQPAPAPVAVGMLRYGMQSEEVREMQEALREAGWPTNATGSFDKHTEKQLMAFQKSHPQLDVDGVYGPATRAQIQRVIDAKSKSKRTAAGGVATGGAAVADKSGAVSVEPFLPTWSLWLMGAAVVGAALYVGWTYRDEIRAWVLSFSNQAEPVGA